MSIANAVSAFTHRGARRATALQLVLYSGGLTVLVLMLSAWIASRALEPPGGECYSQMCGHTQVPWSVLGLADTLVVWMLGLGLFVLAPASVAAAVAAERRAGTLDQLRTTPLGPLSLVAGLTLGAPVKLYLLLVGPLVLHVACGLTGVIAFDSLVTSVAVLGTGGLGSVMVGLAVALAPRQETGGALVALGVAGFLGAMGLMTGVFAGEVHAAPWAFLHPGGALDAAMVQHDGLWRRLMVSQWRLDRFDEPAYVAELQMAPMWSCLSSLALAVVLAAASCRKLAAPHLPLFSKGLGVALFVGVAAGVVLPFPVPQEDTWNVAGAVSLVFSLLLLPFSAVIGLFSAPTFEAWAQGMRRPGKVRFWHDDAAPHKAMWLMALALAGLLGVMLWRVGWTPRDRDLPAMVWATVAALSLPIYVHFLATRYATAAARWAFGAAMCVHLICQAIAIGLMVDTSRAPGMLFVQAAAVAALVVPVVIGVRQGALAKRTRAA